MNEKFELNGDLIKSYLKREARKHSWLVGQLGVSESLINKMKAGYVPSEEVLNDLIKLMGCKRSDLLLPRKKSSA